MQKQESSSKESLDAPEAKRVAASEFAQQAVEKLLVKLMPGAAEQAGWFFCVCVCGCVFA